MRARRGVRAREGRALTRLPLPLSLFAPQVHPDNYVQLKLVILKHLPILGASLSVESELSSFRFVG